MQFTSWLTTFAARVRSLGNRRRRLARRPDRSLGRSSANLVHQFDVTPQTERLEDRTLLAADVSNAVFHVAENAANNDDVGTVPTTGAEGALTYEITSGNVGTAFKINSAGLIEVNDANQLDREVKPWYVLGIRVTDAGAGGAMDTTCKRRPENVALGGRKT